MGYNDDSRNQRGSYQKHWLTGVKRGLTRPTEVPEPGVDSDDKNPILPSVQMPSMRSLVVASRSIRELRLSPRPAGTPVACLDPYPHSARTAGRVEGSTPTHQLPLWTRSSAGEHRAEAAECLGSNPGESTRRVAVAPLRQPEVPHRVVGTLSTPRNHQYGEVAVPAGRLTKSCRSRSESPSGGNLPVEQIAVGSNPTAPTRTALARLRGSSEKNRLRAHPSGRDRTNGTG